MFLFGRKKPGGGRGPQLAQITEQKRQAYRAAVEFNVDYVLEGRAGTRVATAEDLSAGGLRLMGDEDFLDGSVIELRFTLPNDLIRSVLVEKEIEDTTKRPKPGEKPPKKKVMVPPDPFDPMKVRAKIVIAFLNVRRRKFAHGIQFLDIDERNADEVQRFIHIWQIRQLRERAQRENA